MRKDQLFKKYILSCLVLSSTICIGQIQTRYVKPIQTDFNYSPTEDSSTVSRNSTLHLNKLFLFLGGTNSSSSNAYISLRNHSVKLGFDFINLSYPNTVAAASLKNDMDSLAFDYFRQEICFGTQISDAVSVDTLNSIVTRTIKLIQYLDIAYPTENWDQYLATPNTINWSKVIIGGHSQGAGHAAYLAKEFSIDRVLMFSGPNDYSNNFSKPGNWLAQMGSTPSSRHFAYLSLNDEVVDFSKQYANLTGLGLQLEGDSTYVDNIPPPFNNAHFLYTTQTPGIVVINHSVPIKLSLKNQDVWTYMLTTNISTSSNKNLKNIDISISPNPTSSFINLKSSQILTGKKYTLRNIQGQTILENRIYSTHQNSIDISGVRPGIYFLTIDNNTLKIQKQ